LETKKRYNSIFAKFHQELKLLKSVVKTLSGKILILKKYCGIWGKSSKPSFIYFLVKATPIPKVTARIGEKIWGSEKLS
ncbi:hypothetical protein, partial [Methanosarcina sp.]|uniref:hypothetical protein n=1 Tax=Methanosarcina sp. TaxID=2213 RepID=UPI003BB5D264